MKKVRSILTWLLTRLAQQGWSPAWEAMERIANYYGWRVTKAPPGGKAGSFTGAHLIWIPQIKKFSQKQDNPWQMADYYLGELLATFRGYIFAIEWRIRLKIRRVDRSV